MNRYPSWLNLLVLVIFLLGGILALPNIYSSVPSVQVVNADGSDFDEIQLQEVMESLGDIRLPPIASYIEDGRAIVLFEDPVDQTNAGQRLRNRYNERKSIAYTLTPNLPDWLRNIGIRPMSLGLDLRGGVYFLLEVDMKTAIETRLTLYQQSFSDLLREAKLRSRVDLINSDILVRVRDKADLDRARTIISEIEPDLLSFGWHLMRIHFVLRMTETQIKARQDFAIEQNITTLRNRVNQLGVAEPSSSKAGGGSYSCSVTWSTRP